MKILVRSTPTGSQPNTFGAVKMPDKGVAARDEQGRFLQGQSGNPRGKIKGTRNEITLMRLTLEKALREYIAEPDKAQKLLQGIDRVIDIALEGEEKHAIGAMKLLLEKVMPSLPPQLEAEAAQTDKKLTIIIQTNLDAAVPIQIIDGEYHEVDEHE